MHISLHQICNHTRGKLVQGTWPDLLVTGVKTDSRLVQSGDMFVCIRGKSLDGHNFAADALNKGATALMVERPLDDLSRSVPQILVDESLDALGDLAAGKREEYAGQVIAVTGTAGKTTLKEYLAAIISRGRTCAKNYKNYNNQLGVPLSILNFKGNEDFWILEAGISIKGDMDELGAIILPDLAVINNVGPAHLQGLDDERGVAVEKAKLLAYLKPGGKAVLSRDYPVLLDAVPSREDIRVVPFSCQNEDCQYFGRYLGIDQQKRSCFRIRLDQQEVQMAVPAAGGYILENVLAASAAGYELGLDVQSIVRGISEALVPEHRFSTQRLGSFLLIDDSYNANPMSMRSAISFAKDFAAELPLILVLGDMKELGAISAEEHRKLGRLAAETECSCIFYSGEFSEQVAQGFSQGQAGTAFYAVDSVQEFLSAWRKQGADRGAILVKGSRSCALDRYVEAIIRELEA